MFMLFFIHSLEKRKTLTDHRLGLDNDHKCMVHYGTVVINFSLDLKTTKQRIVSVCILLHLKE